MGSNSSTLSNNAGLSEVAEYGDFATVENLLRSEELNVKNFNISYLPVSVGDLTLLTQLGLNFNKLQSLPECIGNLSRLRRLQLHANELETLPESIGQLKKLTQIELRSNKLSILPESIGQMSSLEWLWLDDNKLSALPASIGNLSSLTRLDIQYNPLTVLPESITCLSRLVQVQIEWKAYIAIKAAPIGITQLPCYEFNVRLYDNMTMTFADALKKLKLYKYEGENLANINSFVEQWRYCKHINISRNKIYVLPHQFSTLTDLRELNIASNNFDIFPDVLLQMNWLTSLDISGNSFHELPEGITNLANLSILAIADQNGEVFIQRAPIGISTLPCYHLNADLKQLKFFSNYQSKKLQDVSPLIGNWKECGRISVADNELSNLPDELSKLNSLKVLDLGRNKFTGFPDLLLSMDWLTSLSISGNSITSFPTNLASFTALRNLDISSMQLSSIPDQVVQMNWLTFLNISGNLFSPLPMTLYSFTTLHSLNISLLQMSSFPDVVLKMSWLVCLNISSNRISDIPEDISKLVSLNELNISNNNMEKFPFVLPVLSLLTSLNISGNLFTDLPLCITEFTKLVNLELSDATGAISVCHVPVQVQDLPCYQHSERFEKLKFFKFDGENLKSLDGLIDQWRGCCIMNISNNQITRIPPSISILTQLTKLNASGNQIVEIPPTLMRITSLIVLDFSSNRISGIPKSIQDLQSLTELNIENNKIENLPPALGFMERLRIFNYARNPIQDPPRNILNRGTEAVINYLQNLNEGTVKWTQGRILLLGEAKVGKSTLVKALTQKYLLMFDSVCDENRERTDGIARIDLDDIFLGRAYQTKLQVKVWDFGGQDEFQVTHPFFLSSGALVIILYSLSQNVSENKLNRWIQLLDDFAPGSTVLIVGTHKDRRNDAYYHEMMQEIEKIKRCNTKKHKYLVSDIQVSNLNGEGMRDLKAKIYDSLMSLENVNIEIPQQYVRLKEYFEDKSKATKTMKLEEVQIFSQISLKMSESQLTTAINFLHDLGSILWYSGQVTLRGVVFLDPLFLIDIFRSVFSFKGLGREHGGLIVKTKLKEQIHKTSQIDLHEETFEVVCEIFHFFGLSIPYSEHTVAFPILMEERTLKWCWNSSQNSYRFREIDFELKSESSIQIVHRAQILSTAIRLGHDEKHGFVSRNILANQFCVVFFDYCFETKSFKSGMRFQMLVHVLSSGVRISIRDYKPEIGFGKFVKRLIKNIRIVHENLFQRAIFICPECQVKNLQRSVSTPSLEWDEKWKMLCDGKHEIDLWSLMGGWIRNPRGEEKKLEPKFTIENEGVSRGDIDFTRFDEKFKDKLLDRTLICHASCGKGAFGEVFKCHYQGNELAVKRMRIDQPKDLERIENEISLMIKCRHDFIVEIFNVHKTEKEVSILMELASWSLDKYIERKGTLDDYEIVTFGRQIAEALNHCVSLYPNEVVHHRDLKIENILIVNGEAKLADFGLARSCSPIGQSSQEPSIHYGLGVSGTRRWQAPEIHNIVCKTNVDNQVENICHCHEYLGENVGHRGEFSDVYAFGLILWSMGSGKYPFIEKPSTQISPLLFNGERPDFPLVVHERLRHIIRSCWRQDYKLRPRFSRIAAALAMCHGGNFFAVSKETLEQCLPINYNPIGDMLSGELYEYLTEHHVLQSTARRLRDRDMNGKLFLRTTMQEFVNDYEIPGAELQKLVSLQPIPPQQGRVPERTEITSDAPLENEELIVETLDPPDIDLEQRSHQAIPSRPAPPIPILEMETDELVSYLRGQDGISESFLYALTQDCVDGEGFLGALDEGFLAESPFCMNRLEIDSIFKVIDEIKLLYPSHGRE